MKVLFLTNIPTPYRVDFFNELGKSCELTVLYERISAKDRDTAWLSNEAKNFTEVFLKGIKIGNDSALCFGVIKYLNKSFDLIIVGGYSTPTGMLAIILLKLLNIPFILNADGGMIRNDKKIVYFIKKFFISSANYWLSTSDKTTQYLINYGAKKKSIYKYPFSSLSQKIILSQPISNEEKCVLKKELGMKEKKVIIAVGQFIYRKGFDVLIKSMKDLPKNYGVYIVGGFPTEEYLFLKKKYNLNNLHFCEFKNEKELAKYYKAADLFVLPTREDIWGLVINEAMGFGLPIITTNNCVAGLELIEDGKNGYIVNVGSSEELKNKIKIILESSSLRADMSSNSLKIISSYTIENMAKTHFKILTKIVGEISEK